MKKTFLFLALMLACMGVFADDAQDDAQPEAAQAPQPPQEEGRHTLLSDTTIAEIQKSTFEYKTCVSNEMQKKAYYLMDTRLATDTITKMCEPVLSKMREVYLAQKVPSVIAGRHLKQLRIKVTRDVLQNMMFAEAARKSGQLTKQQLPAIHE